VVHEAPGADAGNTSLSSQELAVLHRAYVGVEPIRRPTRGRVRPSQPGQRAPAAGEDPADAEARARLAALVGAGVRFEVQRGDGFVQGLRQGTSEKLLRPLASSGYQPEATLDLHGLRRDEALRAVHDFVRAQQRTGARYLLIIAGKGQHSPGGVSVLREAVVEALTQGGAAPLVRAFASAHVRHGGSGALAVQLA
jgi:DNA-nicking Smr family endonuclease